MVVSVDFDGTLALGDTASIPRMQPNIPLISLVNEMYRDGNRIKIVTARGSKSCHSFEGRRSKYLSVISDWLNIHGVSYHEISFFKEYADVYFDDKSIDITKIGGYRKLDSEFTRNHVRRIGDLVVKNCTGSESEYLWYGEAYRNGVRTAEVLSYDRDTITTRYINGTRFDDPSASLKILDKFRTIGSINEAAYSSYIERITAHLAGNPDIAGKGKLIACLKSITVPGSFNHGDFSVDNMIQKDGNLYLIDPIFSKNLFQSYYIDIAKHLLSILYYDRNFRLFDACRAVYTRDLSADPFMIRILMASEAVRVSGHRRQFSSISNNLISCLNPPGK